MDPENSARAKDFDLFGSAVATLRDRRDRLIVKKLSKSIYCGELRRRELELGYDRRGARLWSQGVTR